MSNDIEKKQNGAIVQSEMTALPPEILEQLIMGGDLSKLTVPQRLVFYNHRCQNIGIDPSSKPFDYIVQQGKLQLYPNNSCAQQLRAIHKVSITNCEVTQTETSVMVKVTAQDSSGKTDFDIGVISIKGLAADFVSNAVMKAVTKAKRRVTLSICGLGNDNGEEDIDYARVGDMPPQECKSSFLLEDKPKAEPKVEPKKPETKVVIPAQEADFMPIQSEPSIEDQLKIFLKEMATQGCIIHKDKKSGDKLFVMVYDKAKEDGEGAVKHGIECLLPISGESALAVAQTLWEDYNKKS